MKKIMFVLGVILITALLISGCTTKCIPVKPTGIIYDQEERCYVIIENVSYTTATQWAFDCNKIKIGEINWVKFDTKIVGSPISYVCERAP